MIPLKESKKINEVKHLHSELWDKLQEMDEGCAEEFLKECIEDLDYNRNNRNKRPEKKLTARIVDLLKERGFWIAIGIGILCPVVVTFLILWAALIVE
ncbi:hypothetical protein [Paenibacillus sp. RC67]|uniref:hypothetical protein n=1 Tax=Paenibacillus sp. RC67 TaxID=3039392 RepID=UPI0024AD8306|nr:hypothetical protein [Paenibacillus sp. RC67]